MEALSFPQNETSEPTTKESAEQSRGHKKTYECNEISCVSRKDTVEQLRGLDKLERLHDCWDEGSEQHSTNVDLVKSPDSTTKFDPETLETLRLLNVKMQILFNRLA